MKYIQSLLPPCDRLAGDGFETFLGNLQRFMNLNPFAHSGTDLSNSEAMLLYTALDFHSETGENICAAPAAKRLGVSAPAISRTLRGLSKKGYIERFSDDADRRNVRIAVTEAGERELSRTLKYVFSVLDNAMRAFSDEELSQMVELHGRFVDAILKEITERRTDKC